MNHGQLNKTNSDELVLILEQGIKQLGLITTELQLTQLLSYKDILLKWNKVYSLTAITKPRDLLILHILDGLALIPHLTINELTTNLLDVGSGMGVPGVLLAIMCPKLAVTVLDSNSKKCAFLQQVKIELKLANLQVVCKRVEDYQPQSPFQLITSRAFADLSLLVKLTNHLIADNGRYLALKSMRGISEMDQLRNWQTVQIELNVPFLDANRILVEIKS
ncbi:MAG: hypothetical protein RLZZ293_783 [Pseudomonadota bacterium]